MGNAIHGEDMGVHAVREFHLSSRMKISGTRYDFKLNAALTIIPSSFISLIPFSVTHFSLMTNPI